MAVEVLPGFKPVKWSQFGVDLSQVLFRLLHEHQITERVLSLATYNASNNKSLLANFQEAVNTLESGYQTTVIRVLCMAHVIQLSLKDLLGNMNAIPKMIPLNRQSHMNG